MADILSSFLQGFDERLQEKKKQRNVETASQTESDRDRALAILKAVAEGNIRKAQAGEAPSIYAPGERQAPQGIGQKLLEGFGLRKPAYTQGEGYVPENDLLSEKKMRSELLKREYMTAMGLTPGQEEAIPEAVEEAPETEITPVSAPSDRQISQRGEKGQITPFIKVKTGIDKYGNPEYTTKENPEYSAMQKQQEKISELNVKKVELRKEINNFSILNNQIKRAKGGFIATTGAGLRTKTVGIAQPVDPRTGKATQESVAIRNFEGAKNRLRLKLVRAAGDVGNIAIVEQEAQEKLIPNYFDSEEASKGKMNYMYRLTEAVNNEDTEAIKKVLDDAGIGYTDFKGEQIQTGQVKTFTSEQEAEKSGYKGEAIINGRRARIE